MRPPFPRRRRRRRRRPDPEARAAVLFLLPSLAGTAVFVLLPFAETVRRSFFDTLGRNFVGLANYRSVLGNSAFRLAAKNTARFVCTCVPLLLAVSLLLALGVRAVARRRDGSETRRGRLFRTSFLLPMAIPVASIVVLWQALFAQNGLVNGALAALGAQPVDFMGTGAAFWVLVLTYVWKNAGYDMVLWLAGLDGISADLYEAAAVDGAGAWQKFWHITLPNLLPTLALMSSFGPCVALANLGSTLQNTFAAGNRVLDILEEEPVVEEIQGKAGLSFTGAAAEQVSFAYGEERILDGVSVEVPKGSVVGIVGRSGSGKSTLLKLFMRFWEAQQGQVRVSGRDVKDINTANLRDMESFVTQETHLFHDSIRANLRIAKLDATDEEIARACRMASVHQFIESLPQGYDTPVGELGSTLSGGERQRLGLARAFLHQGDFLLLDEPTSNLDSLNEAVILRSLGEERGEKTVLLVSHRKSTMRVADRVYNMDNGRMS